jgi:hypothetical protein
MLPLEQTSAQLCKSVKYMATCSEKRVLNGQRLFSLFPVEGMLNGRTMSFILICNMECGL